MKTTVLALTALSVLALGAPASAHEVAPTCTTGASECVFKFVGFPITVKGEYSAVDPDGDAAVQVKVYAQPLGQPDQRQPLDAECNAEGTGEASCEYEWNPGFPTFDIDVPGTEDALELYCITDSPGLPEGTRSIECSSGGLLSTGPGPELPAIGF